MGIIRARPRSRARFNEAEALKPRIQRELGAGTPCVEGGFNEAEALKPRIRICNVLNEDRVSPRFNEAEALKPRILIIGNMSTVWSGSLQ